MDFTVGRIVTECQVLVLLSCFTLTLVSEWSVRTVGDTESIEAPGFKLWGSYFVLNSDDIT